MAGIDGVFGVSITAGRHCFIGFALHWFTLVCLAGVALLVWGLT
jgi:hypothetical protein